MKMLSAAEFGEAVGVCDRTARRCFAKGTFKGETLPVVQVPDQSGGKGGKVWALHLDGCSPKLLAMLRPPESTDLTVLKAPVEAPVKAPVDDLQIRVAFDRQRILAPILHHPKYSAERATAIRQAAGKPERYGDEYRTFSESTLRGWVTTVENDGAAALMPSKRSDKGKTRHQITRAWEKGCGLSTEKQTEIAATLARTASGLIAKGRSSRTTVRLCVKALQGLTAEAGAMLSKTELTVICKLNSHWVKRFEQMKAVNLYDRDHKAFSDKHEFKVARGLTAIPMEVLYGDCHQVDLMVADALKSTNAKVRAAAKDAESQGLTRIRLTIVGWLEGSSHYLWATPVLLGPGQGITQQDVARSLWEVLRCPHGGIPQTIVIDNGGEFGALAEAVMRFCAMAEMSGLGTVTCKPYSPESKGRLEGAFGILEKTFLSALDGYIAGDRMKSPTKSKGKPRDPYKKGAVSLIADVNLALQQYCGWPQDGDLGGLSPKAMLESKIAATGWLLYYATGETSRTIVSAIHLWLGFSLPLVLVIHIWLGRRARRVK